MNQLHLELELKDKRCVQHEQKVQLYESELGQVKKELRKQSDGRSKDKKASELAMLLKEQEMIQLQESVNMMEVKCETLEKIKTEQADSYDELKAELDSAKARA